MLRAEDNVFLTESGSGTPMGELLRRFWLPVLLSEELPERDGEPKKLVVNFNDIKKEKAQDVELQPYDIVEVADNSGSVKTMLRGMLMGGMNQGILNSGSILTTRIIY